MKRYLIFFLSLTWATFLQSQQLTFYFETTNPTSTTAAVMVYVQRAIAGTENLTGYTVDFYYDNTESTLTSFDLSPTVAMGWIPFSSELAFFAHNNVTVPIIHTGFGTINVFDDIFEGTNIGTTPIHLITLNFDNSIGTSAASSGFLASTANRPALVYINSDGTEFPVVVTGQQSQALPLELTQFTARPLNATDAQLNWTTASEMNSSHFDVQRSIQGTSWITIDTVAAAGNSQSNQFYSLTDKNIFDPNEITNPNFYYRLKMVDIDGQFEYSDVQQVKFESRGGPLVGNPFPNPTWLGNASVQLHVSVQGEANLRIDIYDFKGNIVSTNHSPLRKGINNVGIGTAALSFGVYLIKLTMEDGEFTVRKLTVQ